MSFKKAIKMTVLAAAASALVITLVNDKKAKEQKQTAKVTNE